jgi:hypothetical protein
MRLIDSGRPLVFALVEAKGRAAEAQTVRRNCMKPSLTFSNSTTYNKVERMYEESSVVHRTSVAAVGRISKTTDTIGRSSWSSSSCAALGSRFCHSADILHRLTIVRYGKAKRNEKRKTKQRFLLADD